MQKHIGNKTKINDINGTQWKSINKGTSKQARQIERKIQPTNEGKQRDIIITQDNNYNNNAENQRNKTKINDIKLHCQKHLRKYC